VGWGEQSQQKVSDRVTVCQRRGTIVEGHDVGWGPLRACQRDRGWRGFVPALDESRCVDGERAFPWLRPFARADPGVVARAGCGCWAVSFDACWRLRSRSFCIRERNVSANTFLVLSDVSIEMVVLGIGSSMTTVSTRCDPTAVTVFRAPCRRGLRMA
jgi:hypothetical protein